MQSSELSLREKKHIFQSRVRKPIFISLIALLALSFLGGVSQSSSDHQKMIHEMESRVMPFDLNKTQHVFHMTESGGIQQVIVRDPRDSDQVPLIRRHLRHEAMQFSKGNFSDPTKLHGETIPGIKELEAGASKVKITYSELPNGARVTFVTSDIHLITAIHRWFGAQLSDHGSDATYR